MELNTQLITAETRNRLLQHHQEKYNADIQELLSMAIDKYSFRQSVFQAAWVLTVDSPRNLKSFVVNSIYITAHNLPRR